MTKQFKYWLILVLIFCFNQHIGKAQDYIYKNFGVNDGLPSSEIYHVIQDSKGFLWFATDNGVSRYDGNKFENFDIQSGLINNTILDLYEDWHGRIWFISLSGKLCYYQDSKIVKYAFNDSISKKIKGYPLPVKQSFYVDSLDNVYIGIKANGILKISPKGIVTYESELNKTNFVFFKSFNDKSFISGFTTGKPIKGVSDNKQILYGQIFLRYASSSLVFHLKDKDGNTFFCFDRRIFKIENNSVKEIRSFDHDILWFSKDKNGHFWLSVRGQGIRCFRDSNFDGNDYINYLPGKSVSSVLIDMENIYWFTTLNDGVYYLPSNKVNSIDLSKFGSRNVLSVEVINSNIWLGLSSGEIICFNKNFDKVEKRILLQNKDLPLKLLYHKKLDKLIVGTVHSLFILEDRQLKQVSNMRYANSTYRKYAKTIRSLTEGNGDYFYAGSSQSLDKINKQWVVEQSSPLKGFTKIVFAIIENSDNSIWIGTQDGLWKYQNGKYENWAVKNTLLSYRINGLHKWNNILFIGTKGAGLVMFNLVDNTVKAITKSDGISSNTINSISGNKNEIWIGTTSGVNRIKLLADNTFQINKIDYGNGLIDNEVNQLILNENVLYAATKKGLNHINLKDLDWKVSKPKFHIQKIKINYRDTSLLSNYQLTYFKNSINISYIAISFKSNKNILYKYRLLPIEPEWKNTMETSVNYTTLPPGNYQFEIKARNDNGIWSETINNITFKIGKPFWLKWWFYLAIFLVAVLTVSVIIGLHIQRLKYQNRLKNELNNNIKKSVSLVFNDHFLFNSLNSLNLLIFQGNKTDSSKLLSKISNYLRAVLYSVKQDYISLSDEVNLIRIYMDIEKQRLKEKFNYSIEISNHLNLNKLYIPGILIQPFIETSIWTVNLADNEVLRVDLNLVNKNDLLIFSIQTNVKYDANKVENGKPGINMHSSEKTVDIIEKRIALINELYKLNIRLHFQDIDPSGNEKLFVLQIPIDKLIGVHP